MKAKEYFEQYADQNQEQSSEWRIVDALRKMVLEVKEIATMRNARKDEALISIFEEQNRKCNSFIRMVNEYENHKINYKPDALKIFLISSDEGFAKRIGWK